jgi:hypothetical protein
MHRSNPIDHANHELTLIAGHAAGDLADSERLRAEALLQSCTSCVDLRRDLVAIAGATRALPAPALAHRDFRLDPAQAARLRRSSWLRTLLRPFGAAQSILRPLAGAFTSLGIAGLLVANLLPGLLGSSASAPAQELDRAGAGAPAPPAAVRPVAGGQTAGPGGEFHAVQQASPAGDGYVTGTKADRDATDMPRDLAYGNAASQVPGPVRMSEDALNGIAPAPNPIVVGSLALLAIGLALFGLRFAARRVR